MPHGPTTAGPATTLGATLRTSIVVSPFPLASPSETITRTRAAAGPSSARNVAVAPAPSTTPASADQAYVTASPSTSVAVAVTGIAAAPSSTGPADAIVTVGASFTGRTVTMTTPWSDSVPSEARNRTVSTPFQLASGV